MLPAIFRRLSWRGTRAVVRPVVNRRNARRFAAQHPVFVQRDGMISVVGTLENISISGAAVRVHGWNVPLPAPWPTFLNPGEEIALAGVLDTPLTCQVVAVNDGLLRLRFPSGDTLRDRLGDAIAGVARPE